VAFLEKHPEMRRQQLVFQAARRLQRAADPAALAEQLLDACLRTTGAEGGVILRPGETGMDVWGARALDEAGARELATSLDWAALKQTPGVIVPLPAGGAAPSVRRGKTSAQLTLVRVGAPGAERLWIAILHGQKAADAFRALPEAERAAVEEELALYTGQAALALELGERWPDGAEPTIDPLTDLLDARSLERAVAHEIQLAKKAERQVAVLSLELARLDELRAASGELAAGQALVEAARLVTRSVRDVDLVARTGPQSFAVLLAGTDAVGAERAAARVGGVLANHRFLAREGLDLNLGAGVGTAAFPAAGDSARELLDAASAAAKGKPVTKAAPSGRRRAKARL
jgi:diguanylate cyclase (GGDEF)-like protein